MTPNTLKQNSNIISKLRDECTGMVGTGNSCLNGAQRLYIIAEIIMPQLTP